MGILERVFSEADLISWGSIELRGAHPCHVHREGAHALACDASGRERCAVAHALTQHADQTKTRACTWALAAQVQAYIVRREKRVRYPSCMVAEPLL